MFAQRLSITELGKPRRDHAGRTFKLQSVGKRIRIGEGAPGLTDQDVLVLPIELPQPYRVPVVVTEEIELEIDLYFVIRCYPEFPGGSPR